VVGGQAIAPLAQKIASDKPTPCSAGEESRGNAGVDTNLYWGWCGIGKNRKAINGGKKGDRGQKKAVGE